jgi:hypothetical protein
MPEAINFGTGVSSAWSNVATFIPKFVVFLIIVIVGYIIAAGAKKLIEGSLGGLSYGKTIANLAAAFILAIGVIAALDQLKIASNVVNAILYAALAAIAGIAIVAVGGGGIKTMSQRWEAVADRYDEEKPKVTAAIQAAPSLSDQAAQYAPDNQNRTPAHAAPTNGATAAGQYSAGDSYSRRPGESDIRPY